jgi:hypothetical protein
MVMMKRRPRRPLNRAHVHSALGFLLLDDELRTEFAVRPAAALKRMDVSLTDWETEQLRTLLKGKLAEGPRS